MAWRGIAAATVAPTATALTARASALAAWRSTLDRLAAGTRARLGGEFSGAGLKDQRRRGGRGFDAADNYGFGKHVVIVVVPFAGQARGRGALED